MSQNIKVVFVHPTTAKEMTVEISDGMTPETAIMKLVGANFLKAGSWSLALNETILDQKTPLGSQGVNSGSKLRLIPSTPAGR